MCGEIRFLGKSDMVFKKLRRLFSSSKKVESANTPANSPSESDDRERRSNRILGFAAVLIAFAKKHCKRAETSTLGLNRRSLRVTLEACFSFRNDEATPELNTHQDSGTSSDDHICSKLSCSCCCYVAHRVEMLS